MKKTYFLLLAFCISSAFSTLYAQTPTPEFVGTFNSPRKMITVGNEMYVSEFGGFKISKVADITADPITKTDVITGLNGPSGMVLVGNDLYFTEMNSNTVSKIDITQNPPTKVAVVSSGLVTPVSLAINGNDLYIGGGMNDGQDNIMKIDIRATLPTTPTAVISTGLWGVQDMVIKDNELYFAEHGQADGTGGKLAKIDLTAQTPTVTDVMTGLVGTSGLAFKGNELYFCEYRGMKVSKIDDITATPLTKTELITSGIDGPWGITFSGEDLYITDQNGGRIMRYDTTPMPLSIGEAEITKVVVFPNPAHSSLKISGLKTAQTYQIFNILGASVLEGSISNNQTIEVSRLSKGAYILKLEEGSTLKFLKQ